MSLLDIEFYMVPKKIADTEGLSEKTKHLLVIIYGLETNKGCFATNSAFAECLNVGERQIQKMLKKLKDRGYIEVKEIKDSPTHTKKRIITLVPKYKEIYDRCRNLNSEKEKQRKFVNAEMNGKKQKKSTNKETKQSPNTEMNKENRAYNIGDDYFDN